MKYYANPSVLLNFLYVFGSASTGRTYKSNLDAFDRYRLRPRMLVNATRRDVSTTLFGRKYYSPIFGAPIGVQSILHHDGEEATARACRDVNVPMILSTAATTMEQVAAANLSGPRWYQLYWPRPQHDEVTDLDNAYLPFIWGQGTEIGMSDPVFNRMYDEQQANDTRTLCQKLAEAREILSKPNSLPIALKIAANVAKIRKTIVLKGIQTVEDAQKAAQYGMDGIVVSNHGGRQLDGAVASLDALAEIAADSTIKGSGLAADYTTHRPTSPENKNVNNTENT
ncbi:hypothetical protein E2P81_ATG00369 [Venturia nashicola]|nr:hypothetical protein E2P81_ATG00369 [Venturia nashicola]